MGRGGDAASAALPLAVRTAEANGDLTIRATSRVVSAPLLGFGQTRHAGFARGETIHYYELGLVRGRRERRLVRSFEQLQQARRAGDLTLKRTSMVVNCPFV